MLEQLKEELYRLHLELPRYGLVVWTSGNISSRDPASGLVVIKPSGVAYEQLRPEQMVVVDMQGQAVEGNLKPSSDTASHLYLYRHRPDVNGVVHTHSPYATAFAALGRPIPACLTMIADEFGGPIPCAGFALIGGEEIGREALAHLGASPAVLLKSHGVFTVGPTAGEALKAAVLVEEAARTVWIALQMGEPVEIDPADVARLHSRYRRVYGQVGEVEASLSEGTEYGEPPVPSQEVKNGGRYL